MEISVNEPFYNEKLQALSALYSVMDPELMVNIVDLGLVYALSFEEAGALLVTMTLSTPHCPLGEAITTGVKNSLAPVFPDRTIRVEIVWEPAWDPEMLTAEGRWQLGR